MSDPYLRLLERLTRTLLGWSYEGTSQIEATLHRVAGAYGQKLTAAVLADSAVLTVGERTAVITARPDIPGLDQIGEVRDLVDDIAAGKVEPQAATERLDRITAMGPRFGVPWQFLGLVLFAVGFSLSIQATWQELILSAMGALIVAAVVVAGRTRPRLMLVAPLVVSTLVSIVVLHIYDHGYITGGPIQLMVPVLFFFIPGDVLAAGTFELAYGRWTAGMARLGFGLFTLLELGFGAALAAVVTRTPAQDIFDVTVTNTLPRWVVWLGWIGFTVGVMLVFSMHPRDFPWALLTVLITFGFAQLGTRLLGEIPGTFIGACAMTATILLLARTPTRPPMYVLFLGAFFVLTPGSRGLRGLETWIGGDAVTGVQDLTQMVSMLIAILAGIFLTAAVVPRKWLNQGTVW